MNDVAIETSNAFDFAATGDFSEEERPLLHELIRGLRLVRYVSIFLTVHNRRRVAIHQTEKIRRKA
jgi:hypothetical protein